MRRRPGRRALVSVLAAALLAGGACRTDRSPGPGGAQLVEGRAEVAGTNETWRSIDGGPVDRGDRVRVTEGRAVLALADGGRLELRAGSLVRIGGVTTLEEGDLLVLADGRPVVTDGGGVIATVESGTARLSRTLAFEAAAYTGSVRVRSAERSVDVPALRQVSVAAPGFVPETAAPLSLRTPEDTWDRRHLGDWIDLGRDLDNRSRGLTAQLPRGAGANTAFYRLLLPGLDDQPALPALLDQARPRGETVVGAAIALQGTQGDFVERWRRTFGFRDQGASWGLVALDQAVSGEAVMFQVDRALGRFVDVGRAAALAPPPSRTVRTAPTTAARPVAPTPTTRVPAPAVTTPTTTAPPRPPLLETGIPVVDDVQAPLVQTLEGLLKGVLNLLAPPPRP